MPKISFESANFLNLVLANSLANNQIPFTFSETDLLPPIDVNWMLSPSSFDFLSKIIPIQGHPVHHMYVQYSDHPKERFHLHAHDLNKPALGWITHSRRNYDLLKSRLEQYELLKKEAPEKNIISLASHHKQAQEPIQKKPAGYARQFLLKTEGSHSNHLAMQIFLWPNIYGFLPLKEGLHCLIASSLKEEMLQDDSLMKEKILHICKNTPLTITEITPSDINLIPLCTYHAKKYSKGSRILFGDAAHQIHPLAGQGVNLGLADAQVLSHLFSQDLKNATAASIACQFETARYAMNELLVQTCHQLATSELTHVLLPPSLMFFDRSYAVKRFVNYFVG